MSQSNRYEQQFLAALKAVFIGAQVEGDSGFINLMRIKARYFEVGVFPQLRKDIDAACQPFAAGFREELFDKLYAFFSRYFSESGSIYFRHTAPHQSVYERVYTDDRDVMLFWKTHMLYYVKTDRLFNSMAVTVEGQRFFFDVAGLEHKRANEKRELLYTFTRRDADDQLVFAVAYSEKGSKTKLDDVLKAVKQSGGVLDEATLTQACRVFEKQSEVDYFINKNARAFLREQFDLWLYQYLFKGESNFDAARLRQLQAIQAIAYKIIDFIAQFEDELVRIWNKPKFVRNSHYVITLDKLRSEDDALLKRLFAHAGMAVQLAEWRTLGMVDDASADAAALLGRLLQRDLTGAPVHPRLHFLPLDTRYFPDLELDILATFADLDAALDGWLVHSENYQALVTLLPKFQGRVRAIYIDPPYNRPNQSEILYVINYKRSSWLSLLDNRLLIAKEYLEDTGGLLCAIDDHEFADLNEVIKQIFIDYSIYQIVINHHPQGSSRANVAMTHEYMLFVIPSDEDLLRGAAKHGNVEFRPFMRSGTAENNFRHGRPNSFYAILVDPETCEIRDVESPASGEDYPKGNTEDGFVRVYPVGGDNSERVWRWSYESVKTKLEHLSCTKGKQGGFSIFQIVDTKGKFSPVVSNWTDKKYNSGTYGANLITDLFGEVAKFDYPKSIYTVEDSVNAVAFEEDAFILDFFAGSGTTAHAVMNLNRADNGRRKYILVEMGEHCHTVILPRIKKVAFSDKWKNGKAVAGGQGMSHFVKYYDLEQYEETLRRARYEDAPLLGGSDPYTSYVFLRDLKLLDAVTVDVEQNTVAIDLGKLYSDIDLAETLSCLTGKHIKRITADSVEFADGSSANLRAPDWATVKPLIWW